ncbi:MAG: hypothetical protein DHS20C15_15950 [Planctomycetota bacterium]|nr:MAG: hypothetical protein DHS20C15_15950 [Planctomycetota bacterium]
MNLLLRLLLLLGVVSTSACQFSFGALPLNFTEERSQNWSLEGITELHIVSEAGAVEVFGSAAAAEVQLDGVAKASSQAALENLRMVATREGSTLRLEAVLAPDLHNDRVAYEMRLQVPSQLALRIADGSGSIRAEDVGPLVIADGSGSITLQRVAGDVTLVDGSGSIVLKDIDGSVTLTDGSGSVTITQVRGGVHVLADGSGSMTLEGVDGDVRIDADGSGSISVVNIAGDVFLGPTGSGGFVHKGVQGNVILNG